MQLDFIKNNDGHIIWELTTLSSTMYAYVLRILWYLKYFAQQTKTIQITFSKDEGLKGLLPTIDRVCAESAIAVADGYSIIVLSDKTAGKDFVPIRYVLYEPDCDIPSKYFWEFFWMCFGFYYATK